jgi:hypothetical protein
MGTVWVDIRSLERQAQAMREIATRLLNENDPQKLRILIAELTVILEAQLRVTPPN